MPAAGDKVFAADFTSAQSASQTGDELGFTSTGYITGANVCGVAFVAPTSGKVMLLWGGRFESATAGVRALLSARVRTGGAIDAGSDVSVSADASAVETAAQARIEASRHRIVGGLTPGATYNVVTQHKLSAAGSGNVFDRDVAVFPVP